MLWKAPRVSPVKNKFTFSTPRPIADNALFIRPESHVCRASRSGPLHFHFTAKIWKNWLAM